MSKATIRAIGIAGIVGVLASAQAEERIWDGSGDMEWGQPDSSSWSGETYDSGDDVKFLGDGAGSIYIGNTVTPASIYVDATNDYTFTDGPIASGILTKTNSGTLTIVDGFSYGGSIINGGTLRFEGTTGDIQGNPGSSSSINNGATWELQDTGSNNRISFGGETITFGATGGCTIDFITGNFLMQGGDTFVTSGGAKNVIATASDGHLNMQSGWIEFDVADGDDDIDLEVAPRVHGNPHQTAGTVIKEGAGVLDMTHTGSEFKDTTVNAGTLLMNGKNTGSGTATVNSGGTLGGTGTVQCVVSLSSGGHLAPGSLGVGTLTLPVGLTLNDGSILDMEVDTVNRTSDLIAVTGGTITGSDTNGVTLNLVLTGEKGGLYTLMDWSAAAESGLDLADFNVVGEGSGSGSLQIVDKKLLLRVTRGLFFAVR